MVRAIRRAAFALGLVAGGLGAGGAQADSTGQQRLVEKAHLAVESFLDDPNFRDMPAYVRSAYGVLIVPELLTGGFLVGADYGIGVLMARDVATGEWSPPAFYAVYGGRFGLNFGGKISDVVYALTSEAAVLKLMSTGITLGADASVAAGRTGGGVGAGTTAAFGADVYVFAKSKGLFGGLGLDGSVIAPKHDWNRAYYGRPVTPEEILRARHVDRPETTALRQALRRFEEPRPSPEVAGLRRLLAGQQQARADRSAPPPAPSVAAAGAAAGPSATVLVEPLEPPPAR